MSDAKVGIPFAFLLALSAATSGSGAVTLGDTAESLRPGSLKNLLNNPLVGDRTGSENGGQVQRKSAQWFNGGFFSCFQGYWRRC
jgi:hypothetical protein